MEDKKINKEVLEKPIVCQLEKEYQTSEEVMAKKTLRPIYERDSMERFGDDLTEQVMQYLTFTNKVKFECLSKQWQRFVFNKQTELDLNHQIFINEFNLKVNRQSLESYLKKCQNISRVVLWRGGECEELDLITKYCRRVTKLVLPYIVHRENLIEFGDKHGQWLEEFGFHNCSSVLEDCVKKFVQMCPNIKKMDIPLGWSLSDTTHQLLVDSLKRLEVINDIIISSDDYSYHKMELFVAKYGKGLKKIGFHFNELSSNYLEKCLFLISRFESLESLGIDITSTKTNIEPMYEYVCWLANKCTKLTELCLTTTESSIISDNIFYSLSEFPSLEKLVFNSQCKTRLNGGVECLQNMTQLKHLSITCPQLTQGFFANIQSVLPNLQSLDIYIPHISDNSIKQFVESLQTKKYIERVVVNNKTFFYCKNRSQSKPRILFR